MRNFLFGLVLTLAVAASLIVVIDRFQEGGSPEDLRALEALTASLDQRVSRIEASVAPEDTGPSGDGITAPGPRGIAEVIQLCEEIEGMILDSDKSVRRDLMLIYEKLLARLEEVGGANSGGGGDSTAAREALRTKLSELGVFVKGDDMVEVRGQILEPTRALELIAVADGGRRHESLLLVDCRPSALKIALEDIGLVETEPDKQDGSYPAEAKGAYIYVLWEGIKKPRRVEDLILNRATNETMTRTPFMFTASRIYTDPNSWERHFAADVYKNVIALTWNYSIEAIVACPLEAAAREDIWTPYADTCAPPGTEVRLIIRNAPHPEWDKF